MAFGSKKEIEIMLEKWEFERLLCPHIETNMNYLLSEKGAFCNECNNILYYWPSEETSIFEVSINYNHPEKIFKAKFQKK